MFNEVKYSPSSLDEFIGKEQIKNNLKVYITSSKQKKKNLDHCLLYGYAGTGKTTLAKIIANEMNVNIRIVQGQEIQNKSDIISAICALNDNDILFIDEIHSVDLQCVELLYSIMDEYKINIKIGKEGNSKITTINTPKITIIGATTLLGNISSPLEDRFGIILYLSLYSDNEINKILKIFNNKMQFSILENDITILSKNSKGIPRIAKRLLQRYSDFKIIEKNISVNDFLKRLGIYKFGLTEIDLTYLEILSNNKYTSIKTISQILNIDEKTILNKIEPYLLKKKIIEKNNRGRILTEYGFEYLKKNIKKLN